MTRYKAFTWHLLASIVVLSLIFLLIQQIWYPGTLFTLAAGSDLLRLIVGVDLIMGPLVMLVIFDEKKKNIKMDVWVVLVCQLGFLAYGCWVMLGARPVYFAFVDKQFHLVRANEIDDNDLKLVKEPQFKQIPLWGPIAVGTEEPNDPKIKSDIAFSALGGMGIQDLPQYFVPYNQVSSQVVEAAKPSRELKLDQSTEERVAAYEKEHPCQSVSFVAMTNKKTPLVVVIDPKTAQIIQII